MRDGADWFTRTISVQELCTKVGQLPQWMIPLLLLCLYCNLVKSNRYPAFPRSGELLCPGMDAIWWTHRIDWFQFSQSWFCREYEFKNLSLSELDKEFQEFINFYNNRFHEGIGETPNERFQRTLEEGKTRFCPLPEDVNLDDIFRLTEKRCLKKDNTFSYDGTTYNLTRNRRSITGKAKVELHIHPKRKIRAFYRYEFVQEFPYIKEDI